MLGYIHLGEFFSNSSGYPDWRVETISRPSNRHVFYSQSYDRKLQRQRYKNVQHFK
jgi:hypothetical protein